MGDIYELLNHAEMNLEEFENQGLSDYESRTAKQQILKEIRKLKRRRGTWKKAFTAAACVCIVMGMSTISAAAGWLHIPDSFRAVFGIRTEEEYAAADTMGNFTSVVDEDHGYKISAEGMIGDGKNNVVIFKIEKSDGGNLLDNDAVPSAVEFQEVNNGDGIWLCAATGNVEGSSSAECIEYYIIFTDKDSVENTVTVSLEGMQLWDGDKKIDISGKWDFDIPFEAQDLSMDLAAGCRISYGSSEGIIEELRISPIGFSVRIMSKDELSGSDLIDIPMKMYLKSGEVVELDGGCGPEVNQDGSWSWREEGVYDNMILLEYIEKVVIGNTEISMK